MPSFSARFTDAIGAREIMEDAIVTLPAIGGPAHGETVSIYSTTRTLIMPIFNNENMPKSMRRVRSLKKIVYTRVKLSSGREFMRFSEGYYK